VDTVEMILVVMRGVGVLVTAVLPGWPSPDSLPGDVADLTPEVRGWRRRLSYPRAVVLQRDLREQDVVLPPFPFLPDVPRADDISIVARIVVVAGCLSLFHCIGGPDAAARAVSGKR